MAIVLYLNNSQLYPASGQNIKLTRENPYFTQSESYTLEVTVPMDILENRQFFSNIQRIDASKQPPSYQCRMIVDNRPVLTGTAKVTQVTQSEVKLQLLGGRSEVNFLSENEYIDELPLGVSVGFLVTYPEDIQLATSYVNDETNGGYRSIYQFGLIDLAMRIIDYYGFTVEECTVNTTPWNKLYVASARNVIDVSHVLPHWTPREFFEEFCNFFNVTIVTDEMRRTARIVGTPTFFNSTDPIRIEPADEYSAEMNDEQDGALASDDLTFELSNSAHHDYDSIPEDIRDGAPATEYANYSAAKAAYDAMTGDEGKEQIFRCPVGSFTGWDHDYTDVGEQVPRRLFTQIDVFAPLVRNNDGAGETKLKICPVAMAEEEYEVTFGTGGGAHTIRRWFHLPSLEKPLGDERFARTSGFGASRSSGTADEGSTIQEYIEGDAELDSEAEKGDLLEVMFIDDMEQTYFIEDSRSGSSTDTASIGFTDWQYKKNHAGNEHRHWSLSLNPTNAEHYLGQLHQNGFTFNMKARLQFKFLYSTIPDPTRVYIIRNKRYGCLKIEANISDDGIDRLMTGYFYEMLS